MTSGKVTAPGLAVTQTVPYPLAVLYELADLMLPVPLAGGVTAATEARAAQAAYLPRFGWTVQPYDHFLALINNSTAPFHS